MFQVLLYLMKDAPCRVTHFVEFVNATDAIVGQDQSSGLQHQLFTLGVFGHVSGETHSRRAFARSVLTSRDQIVHI
jgi:hypothetical protein